MPLELAYACTNISHILSKNTIFIILTQKQENNNEECTPQSRLHELYHRETVKLNKKKCTCIKAQKLTA